MRETVQIFKHALRMLDAQVGSLAAEFQGQLQCRKGCSGCCINGFRIRYMEGLNLVQGFVQAAPEVAQAILANLAEENRPTCPLLVDGACALYDHRPALCRAYGVILKVDEKIATCSLNFQEPPEDLTLKSLDMGPYYSLLDDLSQRAWEAQPFPGLADGECASPLFTIGELFQAVAQWLPAQPENSPLQSPS